MKETAENLMWSVYSFIDKEHTKAEMERVLFNKKQRAATEQEYTQKLIVNIGYYQVLLQVTREMMENCFSDGKAPTPDLVAYVVNDIKSRGSDDIFFNVVKDNYLGSNAQKNHGMGFVEKLEYDYVYYCFAVNLNQSFIEYLNDNINTHSLKLLQKYNAKDVVAEICNNIVKCTSDFGEFYKPSQYFFVD